MSIVETAITKGTGVVYNCQSKHFYTNGPTGVMFLHSISPLSDDRCTTDQWQNPGSCTSDAMCQMGEIRLARNRLEVHENDFP